MKIKDRTSFFLFFLRIPLDENNLFSLFFMSKRSNVVVHLHTEIDILPTSTLLVITLHGRTDFFKTIYSNDSKVFPYWNISLCFSHKIIIFKMILVMSFLTQYYVVAIIISNFRASTFLTSIDNWTSGRVPLMRHEM